MCVGGGGGRGRGLRKSLVKRANAMIIIACLCSANLGVWLINRPTGRGRLKKQSGKINCKRN